LNHLLDQYGALLAEVDVWFSGCCAHYSPMISCHDGCSACCRGLFDITLLDAMYLRRGFDVLPEPGKTAITHLAFRRMEKLSQVNTAFVAPWFLNAIPEEDWDALMPEEDETPCLLLSETGGCLVYQHRPMTCRLNGIPLIDISGEDFFDEWCSLNFTEGDPRQLEGLRFDFNHLFSRELLHFQKLIRHLTGTIRNEVDLFIPAALVMDHNKIIPAILALKN
jgi:Fe-S-cluster containining protein